MEMNNDIQTKAQAYAQEALKDQLDAVANAYIQGYNDAMATIPHDPIKDGNETFVDLGLDSGTMWTDGFSRNSGGYAYSYGYYEALNYGIPNQEQFEEMLNRCRYAYEMRIKIFKGPTSNRIRLNSDGLNLRSIWVKSDVVNDEALALSIHPDGSYEFIRVFVGEKLPILRVRNKNEE